MGRVAGTVGHGLGEQQPVEEACPAKPRDAGSGDYRLEAGNVCSTSGAVADDNDGWLDTEIHRLGNQVNLATWRCVSGA